MAKQYALARKNAFWIASILIVLLFAIHVLVTTQITGYDPIDLGLLTKLPITYWIGFACLGVLMYLNRKSERRTIVTAVLIGFFLFAIPVMVNENKADWLAISYLRSSQVDYLLSQGHLNISTLSSWDLRSWPGFFIIAAFLSSCTGLPATFFADYFPLLTILFLGISTYSILRLKLSSIYSLLGSLWFIGCFFTGQEYFSSQAVAYMIYFSIFLLLAKLFLTKNRSIAFPLSVFILFVGAVITHLLTSLVMLAGVIMVYFLSNIIFRKKRVRLPFYSIIAFILLACVFFSYQTLVIPNSFSTIAKQLYSEISLKQTQISGLAGLSQTRVIGSVAYQLQVLATYSIALVTLVIATLGIVTTALSILFHKKDAEQDLFWIAWIIVAAALGVLTIYGGEAIERAFMFMLLPACYFAMKFLNKKRGILVSVLVILVLINIPASYTRDNYIYVPTSSLQGTAFYTKYAPRNVTFLYEDLAPFLPFNETPMGTELTILGINGLSSLPPQKVVNATVKQADFILDSNLQINFYVYFFGYNPLRTFNLNENHNRIFDNEGFRIFGVARARAQP